MGGGRRGYGRKLARGGAGGRGVEHRGRGAGLSAQAANSGAAAVGSCVPALRACPRRAGVTRFVGGARGGSEQRRAKKSSTQSGERRGDGEGSAGGELRGTQGPPLTEGVRPQAARPARCDRVGLGRVRWRSVWGPRPRYARAQRTLACRSALPKHEPHARKEGRHPPCNSGHWRGGPGWRNRQRSNQVEHEPTRGPARRFPEWTRSRDSFWAAQQVRGGVLTRKNGDPRCPLQYYNCNCIPRVIFITFLTLRYELVCVIKRNYTSDSVTQIRLVLLVYSILLVPS